MTTTPTPRPVPTPEDRMRDASEQLGWTPGAATVNQPARTFAAYLDATERDQLDARAATAEAERDEALQDRDDYREARDVLRQQRDRTLADLTDAGNEVDQLTVDNARLRAELGAAQEVIAVLDDVTEQLDRARAAYATGQGGTTPALGSPPPRAQDAPLTGAQLGEMSIRANVEQVEAIRHHARGYADAIAALRDDDRYMAWWSSTGVKPAGTVRQVLAAYLETVGPDGPDVTKPMPEREG